MLTRTIPVAPPPPGHIIHISPSTRRLFKLSPPITYRQVELHDTIEEAIGLMMLPPSDSPQIARGRAQDVYKLLKRVGQRFLNPKGARWIFKDADIDREDTIARLRKMAIELKKFTVTKIPLYDEGMLEHCIQMQWTLTAAIAYVKDRPLTSLRAGVHLHATAAI